MSRALVLAFLCTLPVCLYAQQIVYDDALENDWQNWGWATLNYTNTSPVHSGSHSISITFSSPWQGIQLYHPDMDDSPYGSISFWINGGTGGGQKLQIYALLDSGGSPNQSQTPVSLGSLATNAWQQLFVSLSSLGVANLNNFTGFVIQDAIGAAQPTFYLDDISLVTNGIIAPGTNPPVAIAVNAQAGLVPISPMIYGVAFASSNELSDLNFTMNRSGGNNETRYNWLINAHNLDADWYFESVAETDPTPGGAADGHVANSLAGGAKPLITIPMIGWSPKLGANRSAIWSYSVTNYGPQTSTDPWNPDAGNGISSTNNFAITNNNPNDANFPTNAAFQQNYVQHLIGRWGASTNGGVGFYIMDNEHSIWFQTHQDIHPIGPTMQEIWSKMLTYASMVKSNDPNALVLGPEEWGWPGYFYSGYDQQWAGQHGDYNPADYPDRKANGGWDYVPWLLNQFHQYSVTNNNKRLLDYCTVHCYPQEGSVSGNAVDTATELLRNSSTRQFWDTNYVDPSWINSVIMLIPRMKTWVADYYPGTKIGVTEYNWGAESYMNGATAQADILGIFGRESLDLATRWTTPATNTPTYLAMKLYRNYDGHDSAFGNTSILTTVPNPDDLSAFGALRTNDGALTLMVINKDITNNNPINVSITNFNSTGVAQRWQLTSANVITNLSNLALTNNKLCDLLPPQSITLFVLPVVQSFQLQINPTRSSQQIILQLDGQPGLTYALQTSTDLVHWTNLSTNTLSSGIYPFTIPPTNLTVAFYRCLWLH